MPKTPTQTVTQELVTQQEGTGKSFSLLVLKVKLQHSGHLMQRADSLDKILMMEKTKGGGKGDNRG